MSDWLTDRRGALQMLVACGVGGMAWPAAASVGEVRVMRGVAFERVRVPPTVLQHATGYEQARDNSQAVMERTSAPEVRQYREFIDRQVAREHDRARRVEMINLYVNRNVKQVNDNEFHMRTDVWSPPLHTLLIGGDCEDLALLKRWGLRRVGFDIRDMYLVAGVSRVTATPAFHAVLVVIIHHPDGAILLDNLVNGVSRTKEEAKFEPIYALNQYGFWRVVSPNPADRDYWDDLARQAQPVRFAPVAAPAAPKP